MIETQDATVRSSLASQRRMRSAVAGKGWLDRLFQGFPAIACEEAWMGTEAPPIHPAEAKRVEGAVQSRRIEFATGRACAHRALSRLRPGPAVPDAFVLDVGPQREPCWPAGVVGSITHTGGAPGGYCGVIAGRTTDFHALGLDAERVDGVRRSLWSQVLTAGERQWLDAQDGPSRVALATVMFSAKESFYKAQFPATRRWLDFLDVEIAVDLAGATFEVRLLAPADGFGPLAHCRGRFALGDSFLLTGIAVKAPGAEQEKAEVGPEGSAGPNVPEGARGRAFDQES